MTAINSQNNRLTPPNKVQVFIINRTYVAQDQKTKLQAMGASADEAEKKLGVILADYWQERTVVVPINKPAKE